jgi:hypothetical protein
MHDELQQHETAQFDRLVDGELSPDERHSLLAALDNRPGAWRQCALAFLEAQSWRGDLGAIVQQPQASIANPATSAAPMATRSEKKSTQHWLAIAAGLLVAFGLGSVWQADRIGSPLVNNSQAPIGKLANSETKNEDQPNDNRATSEQVSPSRRRSRDALTFWARDDAGSPQRVHVPLVDAGAVDRQLGVEFRSALPDAFREHLRNNGYDVHSTRRYAPLYLDSGGSLVVPVEDTRIVPISSDVF